MDIKAFYVTGFDGETDETMLKRAILIVYVEYLKTVTIYKRYTVQN